MEQFKTAAANYTLADPVNYSCGMPREDFMHVWRDPVTGDIPWTGAVFGLTTLGIWVWCTDQVRDLWPSQSFTGVPVLSTCVHNKG